MANEEHVDLLKQGADVWNVWRKTYPEIRPDLRGANLRGTNLSRTNLSGTNLNLATLSEADLFGVDLSRTTLIQTYLSYANLSHADLSEADLTWANLSYATLSYATLTYTRFSGVQVRQTVFADTDLRTVKGLETVTHWGPSSIGFDTLTRSQGEIPEAFLRGVGLSDTQIAYVHSLVSTPIEFYTCFISYSTRDKEFADRLYMGLQSRGVRCWFAPEDLKIGDHYHQRIDESIRLFDKLVLILSEHAIQSAWVEREVVAAREKEDREQRPVLFPVRLDDAVMQTTTAWAADVRRRWYIGDFTQWKDHDTYQQAFERLLRDLKAGVES